MPSRRAFLESLAAAPLLLRQASTPSSKAARNGIALETSERPRVLAAAKKYLAEQPITITATRSPRSAGGVPPGPLPRGGAAGRDWAAAPSASPSNARLTAARAQGAREPAVGLVGATGWRSL